jgi:hypothetical protein
MTDGMHTKLAPQSASALHGNCHLNAQAEVVVWVQVEGVSSGTGVVSHFVSAGQGATRVVPPLQVEMVWVWQSMSAPHSASAWQGAG